MSQAANDKNKKYDLEERTAKFGENVIEFTKKIPQNEITKPLINRIVKSGTSIGSNYCEADCAESRKDFEHKLGICKKEARESKHFIRMMVVSNPELKNEAGPLWQEAKELNLIFNKIYKQVK